MFAGLLRQSATFPTLATVAAPTIAGFPSGNQYPFNQSTQFNNNPSLTVNIVTPTGQTCICVPTGTCNTTGTTNPGGSVDGTGSIDIRIVTNVRMYNHNVVIQFFFICAGQVYNRVNFFSINIYTIKNCYTFFSQ